MIDKIRDKYEQETKVKIDALKASSEYEDLVKLKSKIRSDEQILSKKLSAIVRKTGVTIYNDLTPRKNIKTLPTLNEIKTKLLLASHVDGVDVKKLVNEKKIRSIVLTKEEEAEAYFEAQKKRFFHERNKDYWYDSEFQQRKEKGAPQIQ